MSVATRLKGKNNEMLDIIIMNRTSMIQIAIHQLCRALSITKTCPCDVYPIEHHFYIEKLGFAGVYLFFVFLLQNIDCGYSLEPPRQGSSNVYPQSKF